MGFMFNQRRFESEKAVSGAGLEMLLVGKHMGRWQVTEGRASTSTPPPPYR